MRDNHAGCVIVGRSGVRVCEGVGSCHKNWVLQKKPLYQKIYTKKIADDTHCNASYWRYTLFFIIIQFKNTEAEI